MLGCGVWEFGFLRWGLGLSLAVVGSTVGSTLLCVILAAGYPPRIESNCLGPGYNMKQGTQEKCAMSTVIPPTRS